MADRFWPRRRVMVTGGAGFIGQALVARLTREGARVAAFEGRVEKESALRRSVSGAKPEVVFHLAANNENLKAGASAAALLDANIRGTYLLLDACRTESPRCRIVLASSQEAAGIDEPVEDRAWLKRRRVGLYAASKRSVELIARAFADSYGLRVGATRSTNVYGPGDLHWGRLIPGAIRALKAGKSLKLRGDGRLRRDFLYVDDAVDGALRLAERLEDPLVAGRVIPLGTGAAYSAQDILARLRKIMDKGRVGIVIGNSSNSERRDSRIDTALARRLLGWRAAVSIEEGLRKTVAWHQGRDCS